MKASLEGQDPTSAGKSAGKPIRVRRAPVWMRRSGLEWLFRVWQEPKRMWKRYLMTNMRFAVMLARAWLSPSVWR
ncbi:WecB/TagA/CpsF family glycosyltransferase [Cupriavidus sp. CP313]